MDDIIAATAQKGEQDAGKSNQVQQPCWPESIQHMSDSQPGTEHRFAEKPRHMDNNFAEWSYFVGAVTVVGAVAMNTSQEWLLRFLRGQNEKVGSVRKPTVRVLPLKRVERFLIL